MFVSIGRKKSQQEIHESVAAFENLSASQLSKYYLMQPILTEIVTLKLRDSLRAMPKATCHITRQASISARASVRHPI